MNRHFNAFERDFPSLCFALATGVGKTRLVLAPNLTISNKNMTLKGLAERYGC